MVSPVRGTVRSLLTVGLLAFGLVFTAKPARAAATEEVMLDAVALDHLEQQASSAQLKEQCFLYSQLMHSLTEIAGKQLADGKDADAASTFKHIDTVAAKMQRALARDAKRLKNAEMLMEHTTRRLSDMLHITSGDQRTALQSTLQHVSAVQTQILSQVFAK